MGGCVSKQQDHRYFSQDQPEARVVPAVSPNEQSPVTIQQERHSVSANISAQTQTENILVNEELLSLAVEHPQTAQLPVDKLSGENLAEHRSSLLDSESQMDSILLRNQLEERSRRISELESEIERLNASLALKDISTKDCMAAAETCDFDEDREDEELTEALFRMISKGDTSITIQGLEQASTGLNSGYLSTPASLEDWARLETALDTQLRGTVGGKGIDFSAFKQTVAAEIPKMPGRVHWARSLNLGNVLAKHLRPGTVFDGQRGIKEMDEAGVLAACDAFVRQAPAMVLEAWRSLREGKILSAEDANSKFATTEGAFAGRFATLDDFYRGVEHKLGQPNPRLHEGMLKEHCARPNAGALFLAPNYGLCTKPRWEWRWTVAGAAGDPEDGPLADLRERLAARDGRYPGEVGDRHAQTTVRFTVEAGGGGGFAPGDALSQPADSAGDMAAGPGPAAVAERLNRELQDGLASEGLGLLGGAEERLRGVAVAEPAAARGAAVAMAVTLPFARVDFPEARVELFRQAVGRACGAAAEVVRVEGLAEREFEYCRFTSGARLREGLERTPLADLPPLAQALCSELGLGAEAAAACEALAAAALRGAPSPSLAAGEFCAAFGGEAEGARELVRTLAGAFDAQTRAWGDVGRQRKQGRTRDGAADALMLRPRIAPTVARARLGREEFAALRLYTGPLYVLYNALMRDFPPRVVEGLAGNRYETTMFVIISGITKLAKVTPVPPGRRLYRGLGGMLLPEQFWKRTGQGFLGGVELGLMSTTADRRVAIQYSGHEQRRAMMLEIQAGRIDVGGSLGFLSQYAGEDEFLMQPLSCLEVTGRPRMDQTDKGEVLVVPIRVNVNLKSVTVEELTERRKILHLAMAKNLREDLAFEAADGAERFLALAALRAMGTAEALVGSAMVDSEACTVEFGDPASAAGFPYVLLRQGRAYMEVEILSTSKGSMVGVGMAGSNYGRRSYERKTEEDLFPLGMDGHSWGVYSFTGDSDLYSLQLHDWDPERDGMPSPWGREWLEGEVIGLVYDAERGALAVSINGSFAPPAGEVFSQGVRPGPVVGAGLYFVLCGLSSILRYNTGADPAGRPLRFAPPWAGSTGSESAQVVPRCGFGPAEAAGLGLGAAALVERFQAAYDRHAALDAADFNDDQRYKELVNEVLDLKVRLLNKQRAVITLCEDGAGADQLQRCAEAPFTDFGGGMLEAECPYRWRDVFAGFFTHKTIVEVPLGLAPVQAALVWEALLAVGEAVVEVKLGAEILQASSLRERLCLTGARLQYAKYGAAVAGLVIAGRGLTDVDLRGHEFDALATQRLIGAVADTESITTINGCCLREMEDCVMRAKVRKAIAAGSSLTVSVFQNVHFGRGADLLTCLGHNENKQAGKKKLKLGSLLEREEWAFVLARVQALEWRSLELKDQELGIVGGNALLDCVDQMTALRSIDLRGNQLGTDIGGAVAGRLGKLTALLTLDLRGNDLKSEGWAVALEGISRCTWLESLNGTSASWYRDIGTRTHTALDAAARDLREDGAAMVGILALVPSAGCLTALDMSGNALDSAAAFALVRVFSSLVLLRELWLGFNDLGSNGAFVAGDLSTLTSLEVLDLQANRFFETGGPVLAQGLRLLTSLRELYLQYNDMGNQSGTALAEAVSAMTRLEVLDLDGNKMGVEGCQAVASSLTGLTGLRLLDMQRNMGALGIANTMESTLSQWPRLELVISDCILEGSDLDN